MQLEIEVKFVFLLKFEFVFKINLLVLLDYFDMLILKLIF